MDGVGLGPKTGKKIDPGNIEIEGSLIEKGIEMVIGVIGTGTANGIAIERKGRESGRLRKRNPAQLVMKRLLSLSATVLI